MSRFDFESPGAAYVSNVADFLQRQKAMERQAMLDQLAQNADQRAAQQAMLEQQEGQQRIKSQQQQDEMAKVADLTANMKLGDNPTQMGLGQSDIDLLRKHGRLTQNPTVNWNDAGNAVASDIGETLPSTDNQTPQYSYVGTPQEQQIAQNKNQTAKTIMQMMMNPNTAKTGQALQTFAQINGGQLPEQAFALMMPDRDSMIYDEATNSWKKGPNMSYLTQVFSRPYAPPSYVNPPEDTTMMVQEDGTPVWVDKRHKKITDMNGNAITNPGSLHTPETGNHYNAAAAGLGISPTLMERHDTYVSGLLQNPNKIAATMVQMTATSAINAATKASPAAKKMATLMITDPNKAKAAMQQISAGTWGMKFTEADKEQADQLVNAVFPPEIAQAVMMASQK